MKQTLQIFFLLLVLFRISYSQNTFKAIVLDSDTKEPLSGVTVQLEGTIVGARSDSSGNVKISNIPNGKKRFIFSFIGYQTTWFETTFPQIYPELIFQIKLKPAELSTQEVMVTSLRSNSRIEDLPIKVEVLGYEDITEENGIKPGNITSLLGDISGIQIQQNSLSSGEQNLKMLGLNGKYTQILRDGLPLNEGLSGGLGILQIPPLDLKQVEIIKGASPILYGGGAIAGLINLISKEPSEKKELSFTLNRTTISETNLNGYYSARDKKAGITLFAAVNSQKASDIDKDGFSDSPEFKNYYLHPRLFLYPDETSRLIIGYSGLYENRVGGDMKAIGNVTDSSHTYFERNKTYRNTVELAYHKVLSQNRILEVKSAGNFSRRNFEMSDFRLDGNQLLTYSEASFSIPSFRHTTVLGMTFLSENYKTLETENKNISDFNKYTTGVFIQDEWVLKEYLSLASGLRIDYNNRYKYFFLPQLSLLYKSGKDLSIRLGGGLGYKIPGIFTEQLEDNELRNLLPLDNSVNTEHSSGINFDIKYGFKLDEELSVTFDQAFYYTRINNPVSAESLNNYVVITNYYDMIDTKGLESYVRFTADELNVYFGYNYNLAERSLKGYREKLPLTPANKAAAILTYEVEGMGRFGLEASYVDRQTTEDNSQKPDYWITAAMIAGTYRYFELVFNVENLLDTRQSKYEKVVTGTFNKPVFKTLWAPVEGRVFNLSLKITI